ncbi:MAG: hypothetical protein K2Y42_09265 [Hyphomicrobium sp.]|jgi:hypothetical protein|uniref:hypothetical protein n=1 Tax=Hyphomicrobium sp. TaxID=82 RepID=UPI0025BE98CC|nr:hypothetical protein [Hyphomicrobium sp.]MBX9862927.1 hypothetical protein [Hyphomicrobium sp.]
MATEISEQRAEELRAAWDAATPTERLSLNRVSWFSAGQDVTYWENTPSELERAAASRIAALEADVTFVRELLARYADANFDPSMMGPTLDEIRWHFEKGGAPIRAALRAPVSDLGVKLCPHCEGAGTFGDRASGGEIDCAWCGGTGDYRERGRNFLTVDDV